MLCPDHPPGKIIGFI